MSRRPAASLWLAALWPVLCQAGELNPKTLAAWEAYFQTATRTMQARPQSGGQFLWADEAPDRAQRLQNREILLSAANGTGRIGVSQGLIHHWTAAVFIPNANLQQVLAVVQDYSQYRIWYHPTVVESRLRSAVGDERTFEVRLVRKTMLVTAAVDVDSEVRYFRVDARRAYSLASSTRVREIEDYGKPSQRHLEPGIGSGYVWRSATFNRFAERDGGVYVEVEALLLSRELPSSSGWLLKPLVSRISRGALTTYLERTRRAVQSPQGEAKITAKE